jgi:transaldolase
MRPTQQLHDLGQSLWLDNISKTMLDSGQIAGYIATHSVTGLTSNPSIYDNAISTGAYDTEIARLATGDVTSEELFFSLAIADLQRAADLFGPAHVATDGVDGWVSLEVSPRLAYDTNKTVAAAQALHDRAARDNLFIKIPGTPEGLPAIEASIASGIAVNVTLLFDVDQYLAAADAYLKGVERRIAAGLDPKVGSVASVFISRWDTAVAGSVSQELKNRLGLAVGLETYAAYVKLVGSERCAKIVAAGGQVQRLLWASTKTKDPAASDTLYVSGLASPNTVNTMPDSTLEAFYDHGVVGAALPTEGGDADETLAQFAAAGVDKATLAAKLQDEGATAFDNSWTDLLAKIDAQRTRLT